MPTTKAEKQMANEQVHQVFHAALEAFSRPVSADQIQRQAYIRALRAQDWSFECSDEPSIYRAGRESLALLKLAQRDLDPDFELWNEHAPARCRNGASYA